MFLNKRDLLYDSPCITVHSISRGLAPVELMWQSRCYWSLQSEVSHRQRPRGHGVSAKPPRAQNLVDSAWILVWRATTSTL